MCAKEKHIFPTVTVFLPPTIFFAVRLEKGSFFAERINMLVILVECC